MEWCRHYPVDTLLIRLYYAAARAHYWVKLNWFKKPSALQNLICTIKGKWNSLWTLHVRDVAAFISKHAHLYCIYGRKQTHKWTPPKKTSNGRAKIIFPRIQINSANGAEIQHRCLKWSRSLLTSGNSWETLQSGGSLAPNPRAGNILSLS